MANLFQINAELLKAIDDAVDMETGEIVNEQAYEAIEALQMAFDAKVENVALYIKNLESDAAALKAEKDSFAQRQKQAENRIKNLKSYLCKALNGEKFESTRCKISYRKSEQVNVHDESALTDEYLKFKPEVDKTKIKEALKAGIVVPGAELITNQNVQIK